MIQITSEALEQMVTAADAARQGRDLVRADALLKQVLGANPQHTRALAGLGHVYRDYGRPDGAEAMYRKALAAGSGDVTLWNELARALGTQGKLAEALEVSRRAVTLRPGDAETWNDLGIALKSLRQLDEAIAAYQKAISLSPKYVPGLNNYGGALRGQGRLAEAVAMFDRAIAADPARVEIENNRGEALYMMGRQEEAIAAYRRAVEARPDMVFVRDGYLYALQLVEQKDPRLVFNEHRRWDRDFAAPLAGLIQPHLNERSPERRLRVGYVSADLHQHSVAFFIENLLEHHDRRQVEVFCYADPMPPDAVTERLKSKTDQWRDVLGFTHRRVSELVREDGIDIVVDLHGHTVGSRLLAFALKPAPVQVTYCGYPTTTGLVAIDYRLTDAWADPVEAVEGIRADELHSERLVRLPETFLCWRAPKESPPTISDRMVKRRFTFASFNALPKVSATTIALWAEILIGMPEAALLIKAVGLGDAGTRRLLLEKFARLGIAEERLVLVDRVPKLGSHLEMYQHVNVALDTYPYCGTTTTCEALWMGVPVVTLSGKVHASRVGVSLLNNVGLGDLVALSAGEYVKKALQLAGDFKRREELRQGLRERMRQSPLMDGPRFARAVEGAYREMWRTWCATAIGRTE